MWQQPNMKPCCTLDSPGAQGVINLYIPGRSDERHPHEPDIQTGRPAYSERSG
jgi:hypothetical protein